MKKILITLMLSIAVALAAATSTEAGWPFNRHVDLEGSGVEATEERDLDEFDRIVLTGSADIEVRTGSVQKVVIEADDNLLDNIETRVRSRGTLKIDTKRSYSTDLGIKIYIEVPELSYVSVRGSGDIVIEDLEQESVEVSIGGSGDVELNGAVEQVEIDIDGSGDVDARRLEAKEAYISINGSGDVEVFASEVFDGSINGSGDIKVYGDPPRISRSVHGSGDISMR